MRKCPCNDCTRVRERNKPMAAQYYDERLGIGGASKRKTIAEFIKEHRDELDDAICRVLPNARLNDEERRKWILNDEGLYQWARSEGVKI